MSRPKAKVPALWYHISGQFIVTIDGKDFYLGKHDSAESLARYAILIAAYQSGGMRLPNGQGERELWVIGGDLVSLVLLHSSIGLFMEVQSIGVEYGVHGRERIGHCFDRGFLL